MTAALADSPKTAMVKRAAERIVLNASPFRRGVRASISLVTRPFVEMDIIMVSTSPVIMPFLAAIVIVTITVIVLAAASNLTSPPSTALHHLLYEPTMCPEE